MKKLLLALVTLGAASLLTAGDKADKAACSSDQSCCCCCAGKDSKCADKADAKAACAESKSEATKTAKQ